MTIYAELLAAAKAVYDAKPVDSAEIWDRLRDAIEACERKIDGRQLIDESTDRLVPRFTEAQAKAKNA